MPTNLAIDDRLLGQALRIGRHTSKRETVNEALKEYVRRKRQKEILKLFGKIPWDPNYHYKKGRSR